MIKADRVHSTPQTESSLLSGRRRLTASFLHRGGAVAAAAPTAASFSQRRWGVTGGGQLALERDNTGASLLYVTRLAQPS